MTVKDADGASLYNGLYKDMPLSIDLTAGKGYTVKAFYGENVNAGFDKLYVEGSQEFTVSEGRTKECYFVLANRLMSKYRLSIPKIF